MLCRLCFRKARHLLLRKLKSKHPEQPLTVPRLPCALDGCSCSIPYYFYSGPNNTKEEELEMKTDACIGLQASEKAAMNQTMTFAAEQTTTEMFFIRHLCFYVSRTNTTISIGIYNKFLTIGFLISYSFNRWCVKLFDSRPGLDLNNGAVNYKT